MAKKTKKKWLKHKKSNEERYIQLANDYIILCDTAIKMKKDVAARRMACSAMLESNNKVAAMLRKQKLAIPKRLGISTEDSNEP